MSIGPARRRSSPVKGFISVAALLILLLIAGIGAVIALRGPSLKFNTKAAASTGVLWIGDMETGDMSQWYQNGGGGEFNSGIATDSAETSVVRSGKYAAQMTVTTPTIAGVRLFRWEESNTYGKQGLYFSVWYYFPQVYQTPAGWWNVMQWKSRTSQSVNPDPFFILNVGNNSSGMYFYVYNQRTSTSYGQTSPVALPVGKWFNLQAYYKCAPDNTGQVTFWQDGVRIFNITGVQTMYNTSTASCEWSVNNYSDQLTPSPTTIYIDDAVISTNPVSTSPKYLCSNNACIEDDLNGTFTESTCGGTCGATPPPPPPATQSATFKPVADAYVNKSYPNTNYGKSSYLEIDGSPVQISYLMFDLSTLAGKNVNSAKISFKIYNGSTGPVNFHPVSDNSWAETGLTYNNRPMLGNSFTSIPGGKAGATVSIDVTSQVKASAGNKMSLGIDQSNTDGLWYYSRETSSSPVLSVSYN